VLLDTVEGVRFIDPRHARPGDRITVLFSCKMPVTLRPRGQYYELIGTCFVDGCMNGEAMEALDKGELSADDFSFLSTKYSCHGTVK